MLSRCENPDDQDYHSYGGRGIKVCERWHDLDVYITDIETELGPRPDGTHPNGYPLYSIDRTDNDGDYGPGKVRWATATEQIYNSRKHYERKVVLPGVRLGRLTVLAETDPILSNNRGKANGETKHRAVLCRCDCGNEVVVKLGNLPKTASCGCLKRERMRVLASERFGPGGAFYGSGNRSSRRSLSRG